VETTPLGNRLRILDSIADLIYSQPSRKALHDWEQSPVEAEHVISKLTVQVSFLSRGVNND
jgi:hypothetical protein